MKARESVIDLAGRDCGPAANAAPCGGAAAGRLP